jgi:tricarballylate dehydrogenase
LLITSYRPTGADGGHAGITPPKSNCALPIDRPPFEAYVTTPGVTFTFGGLKIDGRGAVIDTTDRLIPGLYAARELVGGLFYENYPGGSGLMAGTVFGKLVGESAAAEVR